MAGGDGCWMRPVWGRDRGLQALRRLAAPRWRRQVDRAGEVELELEPPPAPPREHVEETLARLDLHRPGVGQRFLGAALKRALLGNRVFLSVDTRCTRII